MGKPYILVVAMPAISLEPSPAKDLSADLDLLRRVKKKELLAYRELIDRYYPFVYMVAFALHRDERMADQYVVDIFTHAWVHSEGLCFRGSLRQYFFKLIYAKYQRYVSFYPPIKETI